jgi:hypothetical protein
MPAGRCREEIGSDLVWETHHWKLAVAVVRWPVAGDVANDETIVPVAGMHALLLLPEALFGFA